MRKDILKEIVIFLVLFRKGLNLKGWSVSGEANQETENREFCEFNTGKDVLELSNDLVTEILPNYMHNMNLVGNKIVCMNELNGHIL